MNRVHVIAVAVCLLLVGVAAGEGSSPRPPVRSLSLGAAELSFSLPVNPMAFEECLAGLQEVWTDEFDLAVGSSWIQEGETPWGWAMDCVRLPPGTKWSTVLEDLRHLDVWGESEVGGQFTWEPADEGVYGRGLVVQQGARQMVLLGASAAIPEVVFEFEPYLEAVNDLALDVAFTDGVDEVPAECVGGYSTRGGSVFPPNGQLQSCQVHVEIPEGAPDAINMWIDVTLVSGITYRYP